MPGFRNSNYICKFNRSGQLIPNFRAGKLNPRIGQERSAALHLRCRQNRIMRQGQQLPIPETNEGACGPVL
ncbi:hypothetical protein D3C71_2048290 [compost metagenome]